MDFGFRKYLARLGKEMGGVDSKTTWNGRKLGLVIYLPIYEGILCLISGFPRNTDSARFKVLLTPATPKFKSPSN
jgi:hypothetical protein